MADPFLAEHEIAPLCFDLTGRFHPVSIRDQMVRAFSLVEKLFAERRLIAGSRVLVIGAGAAGVTAGIQAARNAAVTVIVEKSKRPFALQRNASNRWLDPTQYDWPLTHWREPWLPLRSGSNLPMPWPRLSASKIAEIWETQLDAALEKYKDVLEFRRSTRFVRLEGVETSHQTGSIAAVVEDQSGKKTELFNAVICCSGFGGEITSITEFVGIPFWSKNEPPPESEEWSKGSTLIVGGGDGALQDFLVTTTGLASARELFEKLFAESNAADMEREVHCAEDQAQRAARWAGSARENHSVLMFLDEISSKLAAKALEIPSVWSTLNELLTPELPAVTIAHSCTHFGRAYPLNRLLGHMLIQFMTNRSASPRLPGVKATDIVSGDDGHTCDKRDPDECFGYSHDVVFSPDGCAPEYGLDTAPSTFRRVVVRSGVYPPAAIEFGLASGEIQSTQHPRRLQTPPYFLL